MRLAVFLAAGLLAFAAVADTPEADWKKSLTEANYDWAKAPHAVLKIQDAAYLAEGRSASLTGAKGNAASYRWSYGVKPGAVLTVRVTGGQPLLVKDGKTYSGEALAKGVAVDAGVDVIGAPTQISAGVIGARFFVFNQDNPDAKAFTGVDFYPYDPHYRIAARFTPDPKFTPHAFRTSRGTDKQFFHVGDARFTLNGKSVTLPLYAGDNDPAKIDAMSAFFTDGLTGKETYGSGRYVDVEGFGKFPPKTVAIDFNYAYNPNCARSHFFTCPIAIDNIDTDVKAGELDPHKKHG
jgi:uncharacterized protein (DUF1684 family)